MQDLTNNNNNLPQRALVKDIMLSKGKHLVVSASDGTSTQYSYEDILEFFKERMSSDNNDSKMNYWIEMQTLEESEITEICKTLGIHSLTVRDIIERETREKCEFFSNHLFVVVNEIHYEDGSNHLVSGVLNIILFKNMILTFHHEPLISTSQVMRMITYSPTGTLPSAAWIIYAYLDCIIDLYIDLVDKLMMETQSLDELVLVLTGMKQNELFTRIGMAGRRLVSLHSGVFGKSEIISIMLRDEKLIPSNMLRYLRNVQDHVFRMLQKLTLSQRLLANMNNIYMARMSLEVSESSNLINRSMRKFTAVSTVFVPLSLLSGIMGMNVYVPFMVGYFPGGHDYYAFIVVIIIMALFGSTTAFLFKKNGWI
ncbi:hypothetical protein SAMD00019534_022830 [Acytostelium subglobosum LB1]|uniref:hypothetical protein n=1 Tax=Acytostelium subglobosum LB1 TaxID=1410327 RepID=UPI0006450EC7|nr:hypothetical protein SAMD00019534_022830 [Acytostelium subglobosum LB1]GAM19108.1 hypothetical protein SAMD00019534_022830 [Acytostelium subglobosum LB1]|eukprot:XP_012757035.1 hypothetical protein SAMD00019534_022830 [Acytostelium subglobosum LB1]